MKKSGSSRKTQNSSKPTHPSKKSGGKPPRTKSSFKNPTKKSSFDGSQRSQFSGQPKDSAKSTVAAKPNKVSENPRVSKAGRSLRWIIGEHACLEALKVHPDKIQHVVLVEDWERHQDLVKLQDDLRINKRTFSTQPTEFFDELGSGHRGIAVGTSFTPEVNWQSLEEEKSMVLLLDGIEDVQNLGNIMRTAWLMGVKAIFIPEMRSASLTPAVCKVASGGAEHVAVEEVKNFGETIDHLKTLGYWTFGLDEKGQQSLYQLNLPTKVAWVIGSEFKGIRKSTENFCDQLIVIPQVSSGSSYNASIATAICLGEGFRQLRPF